MTRPERLDSDYDTRAVGSTPLVTRPRLTSLQASGDLQKPGAGSAGHQWIAGPGADGVAGAAVGGSPVVQVQWVAGDDVVDQPVVVGRGVDVDADVAVALDGVGPDPDAV